MGVVVVVVVTGEMLVVGVYYMLINGVINKRFFKKVSNHTTLCYFYDSYH